MTRRGMTLIELLAALAILAAVSVAASSWTVSAARTSASVSRQLIWERAANAAIELIASDLLTGDLRTDTDDIEVSDEYLRIRTRNTGPVEHEYTIQDTRLVRRSFRVDSRGQRLRSGAPALPESSVARVLVGDVSAWSAAREEDDEGNVIALSLELHGPGNQQLVRRYTLP